MKVVFAASEMKPFASTGGLSDITKALPEALCRQGVEVIRVIPYYRNMEQFSDELDDTGVRYHIPVGLNVYQAEVYKHKKQPETYFVRRDEFFDRTHLYGMSHRDYDDNFERFCFFQKAVVQLIDQMGWRPDIVHSNDWQTGLISVFLRHGINGAGREMHEKTVFTIHNLAYQGLFPSSSFSFSNLPFSCFSLNEMEYYSQVNCMKAGIVYSNLITTVSSTYAKEIQTDALGCGLDGVLHSRRSSLVGILNGVDYGEWNPETDTHIEAAFSADDLSGKRVCRDALLKEMGLTAHPSVPVLGMVSRLAEQKGLDLLEQAIESLMAMDVRLVFLGMGQREYHIKCEEWMARWPDKFSARFEFNNGLAHRIEAGSDIFMMPSRYEPCGLNQMYSMRYGTLPLVHATGGLKDTTIDVDEDDAHGNGFLFDGYSGDLLMAAVRRAVDMYQDQPVKWMNIMRRIMQLDFSWDVTAQKYVREYERLLS